MIDFSLPSELEMLRDTAARFADDHLRGRVREHEDARRVTAATSRAWRATGLGLLEFSEEAGGAGLGSLARVLVNEELGAADPGAALALDAPAMGLYLAGSPASDDHAVDWLGAPRQTAQAGEKRVVVACDLESRITLDGRHLSGSLVWTPADEPAVVAVLSRTGVLVAGSPQIVEVLRGSGLRAAGAAALSLDGTRVLAQWSDRCAAAIALARVRLYVASLLLGVMREACEYSWAYAEDRVVFGRPVAHHQGVAFMIADMAIAVESCRLLLHAAAWKIDRVDSDGAAHCARAFVEICEQATIVTPQALQLLGGHGFMQDHPVEKFMREARTLSLMAGGVDAARDDAFTAELEVAPPMQATGESGQRDGS